MIKPCGHMFKTGFLFYQQQNTVLEYVVKFIKHGAGIRLRTNIIPVDTRKHFCDITMECMMNTRKIQS